MLDLKKLRTKRGVSQVKLVELTGFSRSKIQRHERGTMVIKPEDEAHYRNKLR